MKPVEKQFIKTLCRNKFDQRINNNIIKPRKNCDKIMKDKNID